MVSEKRIYNADLLEAIHKLDKRLEVSIAYRKEDRKKLLELKEDINGNGKKGIKFQNDTMWEERGEKKKLSIGVKVAVASGIINGLLAAGSMLNIF